MTLKEDYEKSLDDISKCPDVSNETKQLAATNYCLCCISEQLEQINKNLEKIAKNTEKVYTTGYMRTELNKGEFINLSKFDLDTIICNQNKDGHVDKNIVLD